MLSQRRFSADAGASSSPGLWQVPVCFKTAAATDGQGNVRCELLTAERRTVTIDGCSRWIFANASAQGYYRNAYQHGMLRKLAAVAETALTPAERLSLAGDEWAIVRTGRHGIDDYLVLAEGLVVGQVQVRTHE